MRARRSRQLLTVLFVLVLFPFFWSADGGRRPMTLTDLMQFPAIKDPVLSADGGWLACAVWPDRGDGEVWIREVNGNRSYQIPRGVQPVFSRDSRWAAVTVVPSLLEKEQAAGDKAKEAKLLNRSVLLDLAGGRQIEMENAEKMVFSENSAWFICQCRLPESAPEPPAAAPAPEPANQDKPKGGKKDQPRFQLVIRNLTAGTEFRLPQTGCWAAAPSGGGILFRQMAQAGEEGSLQWLELKTGEPAPKNLSGGPDFFCSGISWLEKGTLAAVLAGREDSAGEPANLALWLFDEKDGSLRKLVDPATDLPGRCLSGKETPAWSKDGGRLFVSMKACPPASGNGEKTPLTPADLLNPEKILEKRTVDVWHWRDPRIQTQQRKNWEQQKDRAFRGVIHLPAGRLVMLADEAVPEVPPVDNPVRVLAHTVEPYLRGLDAAGRMTGELQDAYAIRLQDGTRQLVARGLRERAHLSPDGRFVAYFQDKNWHLADLESGRTLNLTSESGTAFYDEENDQPIEPGSYGLAGWMEDGSALLVYSNFHIWRYCTATGQGSCLTVPGGKHDGFQLRVIKTDPKSRGFKANERLLLAGVHRQRMQEGFFHLSCAGGEVTRLMDEPYHFSFIAKAEQADRILYSRESGQEFPDLWVAGVGMEQPVQVTRANPQMADFILPEVSMIQWNSLDGKPLQGVLLKPAGGPAGQRYPVIVYFYEIMSDRMYRFNETRVSHRPSFLYYVSNGYAVFLPDIVFDIGYPGSSILKCLVPGVQKIIDSGVADPKAIGLHGHSWGGYGTAYLITRTNLFAAAVAGAPVANMTSAYSGIRWESGMARQFQYELSQSRIGASLWEKPELYIENSPVFFADRVKTPLLIEHGDEDGAVPWYQGIELYLAFRRLDKPCYLLQYRGEGHHLAKYPNKLDYTIRMREFFDHYLKGKPAPDWMTEGVPYQGK